MLTTIKCLHKFYPQKSYQTLGCKRSKNQPKLPNLKSGAPAWQPRIELRNAKEFMVEFIFLQLNRSVQLNVLGGNTPPKLHLPLCQNQQVFKNIVLKRN